MATQAPLHLERRVLIHNGHLVDLTMTSVTADALGHVDAVIEINEIGERIDARPLQRFARAVAGTDWLKQLRIRPDLRVAVHAGLGRRDPRKTGNFHGGVAVTAIDAESGDMMLMTEGNRLRLAHALIGHVRGALHDVGDASQCGNDEHCAKNGGARQRVRAAMKDLRHSLMRSGSKRPGGAFCADPRVSASVLVPSEKTTHRGFRSVCETGNYKYFRKLCRVILKISGKKFSSTAGHDLMERCVFQRKKASIC